MKKRYNVFLEDAEYKNLKQKAANLSIEGTGWLSKFVQHIAANDIIFLDENIKKVLKMVSLK